MVPDLLSDDRWQEQIVALSRHLETVFHFMASEPLVYYLRLSLHHLASCH